MNQGRVSMIDKDSLIIVGIIFLTAFWAWLVKIEAAALINTTTGGLLGYLGASAKNALSNPSVFIPSDVVTGLKPNEVRP